MPGAKKFGDCWPTVTKSYFFKEIAACLVSWSNILLDVYHHGKFWKFLTDIVLISNLIEQSNRSDLENTTVIHKLQHSWNLGNFRAKHNVVFHCTPKFDWSEHLKQSVQFPSLAETVRNTGSLVIKNSSIHITQIIIFWFIKIKQPYLWSEKS